MSQERKYVALMGPGCKTELDYPGYRRIAVDRWVVVEELPDLYILRNVDEAMFPTATNGLEGPPAEGVEAAGFGICQGSEAGADDILLVGPFAPAGYTLWIDEGVQARFGPGAVTVVIDEPEEEDTEAVSLLRRFGGRP